MIKMLTSAAALAAGLSLAGAALAQPSGGPDAKGNAPLKAPHTVNDGSAKRGANSFTEGQARQHIEKSGFTSVTQLVKGDDGVWRGQAMRGGAQVPVAMDFKGNVSTPSPEPAAGPMRGDGAMGTTSTTRTTSTTMAGPSDGATGETHHTDMARMHHHRRHHHHMRSRCADPAPNGAACSGVDKNHNGVSDKEDRARADGAHP